MTTVSQVTLFCVSHMLQAGEIKSGMDIFNIPQPPYKELVLMDKELELLEKTWSVVAEWQKTYAGWKDGKFRDIKVCLVTSHQHAPASCLCVRRLQYPACLLSVVTCLPGDLAPACMYPASMCMALCCLICKQYLVVRRPMHAS